jgi:hypothetical protein
MSTLVEGRTVIRNRWMNDAEVLGAAAVHAQRQERGSGAEQGASRIGSRAGVLYTSPDRKAANHSHTPVASLLSLE